MIVIQRKADGRYLQRREHGEEIWTLKLDCAKVFKSAGTALNGMIQAAYDRWHVAGHEFDRLEVATHIKTNYQFVSTIREVKKC